MRTNSRILEVRGEQWSNSHHDEYIERRCRRLIYTPGADVDAPLDFLCELPDLHTLVITTGRLIKDDSAIFELTELRTLVLETSARNHLAFTSRMRHLTRLEIIWRHRGLESIENLPLLESFTLWDSGDVDPQFSPAMNRLKIFRVHLKRGRTIVSARSLTAMPGLETVWIEGGCAVDLDMLPPSVTELPLDGVRIANLDFIHATPQLHALVLLNCEVPTLQPLTDHPNLRRLGLYRTRVSDNDASPVRGLIKLAPEARNQPIRGPRKDTLS